VPCAALCAGVWVGGGDFAKVEVLARKAPPLKAPQWPVTCSTLQFREKERCFWHFFELTLTDLIVTNGGSYLKREPNGTLPLPPRPRRAGTLGLD